MAKWYGAIGFALSKETAPGVWKDEIVERKYTGEVRKSGSRWSASQEGTNDDLTLNIQISIISDPFAKDNSHLMKYIKFMGAAWKVASVDVEYPRLLLTIGGVYNGKQA